MEQRKTVPDSLIVSASTKKKQPKKMWKIRFNGNRRYVFSNKKTKSLHTYRCVTYTGNGGTKTVETVFLSPCFYDDSGKPGDPADYIDPSSQMNMFLLKEYLCSLDETRNGTEIKKNFPMVYEQNRLKNNGKLVCSYCQRPDLQVPRKGEKRGSNWQATIDHVHPQSKGGSNKSENLVCACNWCNSRKSNMTVEEFKRWLDDTPKARGRWLPPEIKTSGDRFSIALRNFAHIVSSAARKTMRFILWKTVDKGMAA